MSDEELRKAVLRVRAAANAPKPERGDPGRWGEGLARVGGLALILAALFVQSYQGRVNIVSELRSGCERTAVRNAADANRARAQDAADVATAATSDVPADVRAIKRIEATAELTSVLVDDSQIDRGRWYLLVDPRDRRAVRDGQWVYVTPTGWSDRGPGRVKFVRAFRCERAYPPASPIELVR